MHTQKGGKNAHINIKTQLVVVVVVVVVIVVVVIVIVVGCFAQGVDYVFALANHKN